MSYQQKPKVQKVMVQPINLIFRYLQSRARVQVWLYENQNLRIEGHIIGFDEYMNVMLDQAEEVHMKKETRKAVGRILLKGDNITLIQNTVPYEEGDQKSCGSHFAERRQYNPDSEHCSRCRRIYLSNLLKKFSLEVELLSCIVVVN